MELVTHASILSPLQYPAISTNTVLWDGVVLIQVTWRVGGLSKWVISRLISTLLVILIGAMLLITVQNSYLLSATKCPDSRSSSTGV